MRIAKSQEKNMAVRRISDCVGTKNPYPDSQFKEKIQPWVVRRIGAGF
jgi:hypothetical protein